MAISSLEVFADLGNTREQLSPGALAGESLCRGGILPVARQRGGIVDTTMTIKDASFLPILRAVGKAVQNKRLHLGISQEELARRAKLHRTYISDVERGSRSVSLITLVKLAEALQTNASVLVECAEKNAGDDACELKEN